MLVFVYQAPGCNAIRQGEKLNDVTIAHSDTSVRCRSAEQLLLVGAMDIDEAIVAIDAIAAVLARLSALKSHDSGKNKIFALMPFPFGFSNDASIYRFACNKNLSGAGIGANTVGDFVPPERRFIRVGLTSCPVFAARNSVSLLNSGLCGDVHLLPGHTDIEQYPICGHSVSGSP